MGMLKEELLVSSVLNILSIFYRQGIWGEVPGEEFNRIFLRFPGVLFSMLMY